MHISYVCLCKVVSNTYCVVSFFFFVLCALWCRVLWIVRFWLPLLRLVCPVVPGSLDFPFLIVTSSSCVPCGAGLSGLSVFDCHYFVSCALWCRVLWIVRFWLPLRCSLSVMVSNTVVTIHVLCSIIFDFVIYINSKEQLAFLSNFDYSTQPNSKVLLYILLTTVSLIPKMKMFYFAYQ